MEMSLDNSRRLERKRYLFEYRGIRFCLIQDNPRKHPDHLLTILKSDDEKHRDAAFAAAAEFASALCWQNNAAVVISEAGLRTPPPGRSLARMKPTSYDLPHIMFEGMATGYGLETLPYIETDLQRIALALFRQARASNNVYLSFLFFWQVLEVNGRQAINVVDSAIRKNRTQFHLPSELISNLPLERRNLGQYLLDDCRHAIAHIRRRVGQTNINLDVRADRRRLGTSTEVIKIFAEWYIRNALNLKKRCFLLRNGKRGFPAYIPEDQTGLGAYHRAYAPRPWKPFKRRDRSSP